MENGPMNELERRWQMMLGGDVSKLGDNDRRITSALDALYESTDPSTKYRRGGLGGSVPRVAKWMGDIRECFPTSVVQIIQRDAFTRLGLRQMLLEPEFLTAMQADVNLVADLMSLKEMMPERTKQIARQVIQKVVKQLIERLEQKTVDALRGALDRSKRTSRPRAVDIDWSRTIRANLHQYLPEFQTIVPERLIGFARKLSTNSVHFLFTCESSILLIAVIALIALRTSSAARSASGPAA
jgi:hypothetical protein